MLVIVIFGQNYHANTIFHMLITRFSYSCKYAFFFICERLVLFPFILISGRWPCFQFKFSLVVVNQIVQALTYQHFVLPSLLFHTVMIFLLLLPLLIIIFFCIRKLKASGKVGSNATGIVFFVVSDPTVKHS